MNTEDEMGDAPFRCVVCGKGRDPNKSSIFDAPTYAPGGFATPVCFGCFVDMTWTQRLGHLRPWYIRTAHEHGWGDNAWAEFSEFLKTPRKKASWLKDAEMRRSRKQV